MTEETQNTSGIQRGDPASSDARQALVTRILGEIKADKAHHAKAFKRMRDDMKFAAGAQLPGELVDDERPKVDIVQRHLNQAVASLYAKNPTFVAKRRTRLDFAIWDGDRASLEKASVEMQGAAQTGMPPTPDTMALLQDIQEGITRRRMLDAVGKTLEILMDHSLDEQQPNFKVQCKQFVRRAKTCGVGYIEVGYQRQLAPRPETVARLNDITDRLAQIEQLQADVTDKKIDEHQAEAEELTIIRQALQDEPDRLVREGVVFDFPAATRIIPDRATRQIKGWVGSQRVSKEIPMTADEIKRVYGIDIGAEFMGYDVGKFGILRASKDGNSGKHACVYECYDRVDGVKYIVVDGYKDFLKPPAAPDVFVEQFFPFFGLTLNDIEAEEELFPRSDVRLLRPIQQEINRKKHALQQHRIANRPRYLAQKGKFEETDLKLIAGMAAHDFAEVTALGDGEKMDQVVQAFPSTNIDPNMYETAGDVSDMQLVVGAQEANLGSTNGDTATQSAIAEGSRVASIASNIDDLDDCLSAVARAVGQIMLREYSVETVQRIAGPGSVWPDLDATALVEEVYLEIEAGSSGRPNKEQELANVERVTPLLVQIPGVNPEWLLKFVLKTLDTRIDYEDAITAGLPSITAMNGQKQLGTGDPATDPNSQGGRGAQNTPSPTAGAGGPQAAMPAPTDGTTAAAPAMA